MDLHQLAADIDCSTYEPSQFPGLIYKPPVGGTLSLFASGKYTITGIKNEIAMRDVENQLFDELRSLGISLEISPNATIRNIVCTGDLGQELDLSTLSVILGVSNVEYEPEQSPFLIYRPKYSNCVMTIASTGKTVITGLVTKDEAEEAFANLAHEISQMVTNDDK